MCVLWVGSVLTMRVLLVDLDTMHRCIMNMSQILMKMEQW